MSASTVINSRKAAALASAVAGGIFFAGGITGIIIQKITDEHAGGKQAAVVVPARPAEPLKLTTADGRTAYVCTPR